MGKARQNDRCTKLNTTQRITIHTKLWIMSDEIFAIQEWEMGAGPKWDTKHEQVKTLGGISLKLM